MSDYEYRVTLADLPVTVPSLVSYDDDGFPTILVNSRLSYEGQLDAVEHEMFHIVNGDVFSDEDIKSVELRAEKRS